VAYEAGADLTSEKEVKSLMEKVRKAFGGLDIVVNNTGDVVARKPLEEMTLEFFRKVSAVNLESMLLIIREAFPLMKDRGGTSIVNIASEAGRKGGNVGSLAYATTKGAILTLTRALSTELAPYGIRVNAVAPGFTLGSRLHTLHTKEELQNKIISSIPLGRAGTCEDTARAVAFLASEYDGFITGATLDINGGTYLG
jgi:3-oxoacyl-[acyl-carrier protein] reductase